MEQKEYTEYIIPKIIDKFPQFSDSRTAEAKDIINIDCKSKTGKLTLRLSTQNKEITIGFAYDTKFDWHTHMSMFGANTPEEEYNEAIILIDRILSDKEIIVHSTVSGYFIADDIDHIDKYKEENEIIETFYWSEL